VTRMSAAIPIVIPVYHKPWQLERCLDALQAQSVPVDPWIHDNSVENLGCTRAFNLGLRRLQDPDRAATHRYAILLNQDCYLAPDAVEAVVTFMDDTPRCAIAGIKQFASYDPDLIIHGGCTVAHPTGMHLMGRRSLGQCVNTRPMPWVNGGCMVVRLEAIADFGLMDERMVQFGSDSDWCYAARVKGWEVWYCAEAECVHEMQLSRGLSGPALATFQGDMAHWAQKWLGSPLYSLLAHTVLPAPGWPSILHGALAMRGSRTAPPASTDPRASGDSPG
jgi:GT2 family glycosyltransferase